MGPRSQREPRAHGGLLDRELAGLGMRHDEVLDVSVNVNPYGPCAAVVEAIRSAPVDRYPDPTAHGAREAIASAAGTSASGVVVGNGAVDLLWTLVRALLGAGGTAIVVEPAFSEFAAAVAATGGQLVPWRARAEAHFAVDLESVADLAWRTEARLAYLCSPANPTGMALDPPAVAAFARANPRLTVVLDESFVALSERPDDEHAPMPDNVVRVRSMTKAHALPGVRVGYLLARDDLAARIEAARPPWTASAFAQAAAIAAVRARSFVDDSRARVLADRRRLVDRLRALGHAPMDSSTLFFLLPVRDGRSARERLLTRHRVLVRDGSSFGLPDFIRVCAQPLAHEPRLLSALSALEEEAAR
jgi:histidinol-phosphate/aromatic aminotransferase/cobyric acid decarboxylase-like protein